MPTCTVDAGDGVHLSSYELVCAPGVGARREGEEVFVVVGNTVITPVWQ